MGTHVEMVTTDVTGRVAGAEAGAVAGPLAGPVVTGGGRVTTVPGTDEDLETTTTVAGADDEEPTTTVPLETGAEVKALRVKVRLPVEITLELNGMVVGGGRTIGVLEAPDTGQ